MGQKDTLTWAKATGILESWMKSKGAAASKIAKESSKPAVHAVASPAKAAEAGRKAVLMEGRR